MKRIKFKGEEFVLVGETDGPIATLEAFAAGEVSFAHLGADGVVRRFHEVIGTLDDIEFLGDVRDDELPQMDPVTFVSGILGDTWEEPEDDG